MEQEVQEQNLQRVVKRRKSAKDDTDRKYACSTCGKAFKHKHHRTEHERLHTGEKPFECEWCGKRFAHSGSYSQHRNQAWCKNAEGRDREKKKPRSKGLETEKKKPNTKVLKARQVDETSTNITHPHQIITSEQIKQEPTTKQAYPVLNSQLSQQAYQHMAITTTEPSYQIPTTSVNPSYQQAVVDNKELSYQQIAKLLQAENGAQIPAEFAQSASAWLVENANMQNMIDVHVSNMSQSEQAVGTSNVQYLYTIPGDQTTYCLSGIPYVNKVAEVQNEVQEGEQENISSENSQSAYECYNIFNVQPRSESSNVSKAEDGKDAASVNYSIFNVSKTDAETAVIEAGALESSAAVSHLLGYEGSQNTDGSQEVQQLEGQTAHDTKEGITSHLPTYEEAVKKEIITDGVQYVPIKTEDPQDDSRKYPPALIPASQLVTSRLPFPINVIQCVLCQEECADTNALVEHIKNKHYCQVAGQLSSANHAETLQEKTTTSVSGFTMTS